MSQWDTSWISHRSTPNCRNQLHLLPQFSPPPEITKFSIEKRPPHIHSRNTHNYVCFFVVITSLYFFLGYFKITFSERDTSEFEQNGLFTDVKNVVKTAIYNANAKAEESAQLHYNAREEYLNRRKLNNQQIAKHAQSNNQEHSPSYNANQYNNNQMASKIGKSSLLLRMEALSKDNTKMVNYIDAKKVQQFFPKWVVNKEEHTWDQKAVLEDLVIAVSQLSMMMAFEDNQPE
jgi:hypothetical protein